MNIKKTLKYKKNLRNKAEANLLKHYHLHTHCIIIGETAAKYIAHIL